MYDVDEKDAVVPLHDLPPSAAGAPCPIVIADEFTVSIAYYVEHVPAGLDASRIRPVGPNTVGEPAAVITFESYSSMMFGMPNDEALFGHPLAPRGLTPYGAFEVRNSSWIRRLDRINAVHPQHRAGSFSDDRHFILAFHDSTFEIIAQSYTIAIGSGPLTALAAELARRLGE